MSVNAGPLSAQEAAPGQTRAADDRNQARLSAGLCEPELALSVLDVPPRDEGVAGANVAIADNNTTGKFMGQQFTLDVTEVKPDADVVQTFRDMVAKGDRYVLADISAKQLLSIADIARENGVLIFNVGATDDILREEECRAERLPHGADPLDAGRRAGAIPDLEAMAAMGAALRLA